jgi:FdhD protein
MSDLPSAKARMSATSWREGPSKIERVLPEEVAVAITYEKATFAVMMASPLDLHDFAVGFSISEGIVADPADITKCEIVPLSAGIECRMSLAPGARDALDRRRRHIAGPVGCGLCGLDSLEEAVRPVRRVTSDLAVTAKQIAEAIVRLPALQKLNQETRGVHAAACFQPSTGRMLVREDVGRHNALDKLIGTVLTEPLEPDRLRLQRASAATESVNQPLEKDLERDEVGTLASTSSYRALEPSACIVLLTSRVSIDLIQKTAVLGCPILVAVSVPTARAVREAEAAGITLIAIARNDGFEVFTHPERITDA